MGRRLATGPGLRKRATESRGSAEWRGGSSARTRTERRLRRLSSRGRHATSFQITIPVPERQAIAGMFASNSAGPLVKARAIIIDDISTVNQQPAAFIFSLL